MGDGRTELKLSSVPSEIALSLRMVSPFSCDSQVRFIDRRLYSCAICPQHNILSIIRWVRLHGMKKTTSNAILSTDVKHEQEKYLRFVSWLPMRCVHVSIHVLTLREIFWCHRSGVHSGPSRIASPIFSLRLAWHPYNERYPKRTLVLVFFPISGNHTVFLSRLSYAVKNNYTPSDFSSPYLIKFPATCAACTKLPQRRRGKSSSYHNMIRSSGLRSYP